MGLQPSVHLSQLVLVGNTQTIGVFLVCRHKLSTQPPSVPEVLQGDDVDALRLINRVSSLPARRGSQLYSFISLDYTAETTH